jgi:hypothetical protein
MSSEGNPMSRAGVIATPDSGGYLEGTWQNCLEVQIQMGILDIWGYLLRSISQVSPGSANTSLLYIYP